MLPLVAMVARVPGRRPAPGPGGGNLAPALTTTLMGIVASWPLQGRRNVIASDLGRVNESPLSSGLRPGDRSATTSGWVTTASADAWPGRERCTPPWCGGTAGSRSTVASSPGPRHTRRAQAAGVTTRALLVLRPPRAGAHRCLDGCVLGVPGRTPGSRGPCPAYLIPCWPLGVRPGCCSVGAGSGQRCGVARGTLASSSAAVRAAGAP